MQLRLESSAKPGWASTGRSRVRSTNPAWLWRHQPFLPGSTQQPVWWSIQEHIFWDAKLISLAWNRHVAHPPQSGSSLTCSFPERRAFSFQSVSHVRFQSSGCLPDQPNVLNSEQWFKARKKMLLTQIWNRMSLTVHSLKSLCHPNDDSLCHYMLYFLHTDDGGTLLYLFFIFYLAEYNEFHCCPISVIHQSKETVKFTIVTAQSQWPMWEPHSTRGAGQSQGTVIVSSHSNREICMATLVAIWKEN